MILIEGPRNVGKTFLLDHFSYPVNKFKAFDYMKTLRLNKFAEWGFSCGKDLMFNMVAKYLPPDYILDRGFLSSIVYSILLERTTEKEANRFLSLIDPTDMKIIYITGVNPSTRKKDALDYLDYGKQLVLYDKYIEKVPHISFTNNFDEESITRFNNLLEGIINEYIKL